MVRYDESYNTQEYMVQAILQPSMHLFRHFPFSLWLCLCSSAHHLLQCIQSLKQLLLQQAVLILQTHSHVHAKFKAVGVRISIKVYTTDQSRAHNFYCRLKEVQRNLEYLRKLWALHICHETAAMHNPILYIQYIPISTCK